MPAPKLDNVTPMPAVPHQGMATITRVLPEGGYWLEAPGREGVARRAASCLLEPAVGDTVWAVGEGGEHYVIAVLERALAPAVVSLPGDATLRAEGTLTVAGGQGLSLTSPEGLGVRAQTLRVHAEQSQAVFGELSVVARSVFASMARVTRVGKVLELMVDRVMQRSTHSVRVVDGLDRTQAQTLDLRASGDAHLQATHALVNGKNLVKMDGGQIHLG